MDNKIFVAFGSNDCLCDNCSSHDLLPIIFYWSEEDHFLYSREECPHSSTDLERNISNNVKTEKQAIILAKHTALSLGFNVFYSEFFKTKYEKWSHSEENKLIITPYDPDNPEEEEEKKEWKIIKKEYVEGSHGNRYTYCDGEQHVEGWEMPPPDSEDFESYSYSSSWSGCNCLCKQCKND